MNLKKAFKKVTKDFESKTISKEKIDKILEDIEEDQQLIRTLPRDLNNFERLKIGRVFDDDIHNNKRGWLGSHKFPITLEILNKEKVPGGKVTIPSWGGEQDNLLVYHAICPELENFVSLIVWLNSESSKNAWEQILELINTADETKVLQFSEKCGINLPNTIHPSHDQDSRLVEKDLYKSLYDWKYTYYLFDDGKTIMSHNSPINYRHVILDEKTKDESFIGIRTTVGRLISKNNNFLCVSIPCLNDRPRNFEWQISKRFDISKLKINGMYFFQIYKIVGEYKLETHVRTVEEAMPVDIVGMFLSQSLYLKYLGSSKLKLLNQKQFEKLFLYYYEQICRFCLRDNDEIPSMDNINWESIQFAYTDSFTKLIGNDLYFIPPLLRRFLGNNDFEIEQYIIQRFDESLRKQNVDCISKNSFTDSGKRVFSSRSEISKTNNVYHFIHFLLKAKRFILGIEQNPNLLHNREIEIKWLQNKFNI